MKIVLGDDLCGQEQEFRKWACEVFKTSCDVFCLDTNEMSEASMSLKSETLTKENTRFQAIKDFNIPLDARLSKYHNKQVQVCKVKNKPINLHGVATSERSTVLVEIIIDSVSLHLSFNVLKNYRERFEFQNLNYWEQSNREERETLCSTLIMLISLSHLFSHFDVNAVFKLRSWRSCGRLPYE